MALTPRVPLPGCTFRGALTAGLEQKHSRTAIPGPTRSSGESS